MNRALVRSMGMLCVFALICFGAGRAGATSTGRFGAYQGGCGGGGCHAQSGNTTVGLTGPRTVDAGTTVDYTFTVAHANNGYGGMNISFRTAQGAAAGALTAGNGSQVGGGELTHNGPKAAATGVVSFPFQWTAPNAHGTYTFYGAGNAVNNDNSSNGDAYNTTGAITISVPGATLTSPNPGVGFCVGATITINWTQTAMTNLRIEMSANDFGNIIVINNSIAATAGTYSYTVPAGTTPGTTYAIRLVNTANSAELNRVSNLTISGGPTILTHPVTQEVCENRSIQLTCGASGSSLTYQWRKGGTSIPGGNSAILNLTNVSDADAGSYDCQITGCSQTVTTNAATITIAKKPTITSQPASKTLCEDDSVSFSITATGNGVTYQWLLNGVPVAANGTSATYRIASAQASHAGTYRCRVNGTCTPQATSDSAVLKVLVAPTITAQPADKTLQAGEQLKLSVTNTGEAVTYQWQKNGADIAGETNKDYIKNGVARSDSGKYKCVVKNQCGTVNSREAVVKVNAAPGPGILALTVSSLNIGDLAICAERDTVVTALLANEGGSDITVSAAVADPSAVITVSGLTLPLTIPSNGVANVTFKIKPAALGAITGTVAFTSTGGNKTLDVAGTAVTSIVSNKDSITFDSATGVIECLTIDASVCNPLIVSGITITGGGAASFKLNPDVTFPVSIVPGTPKEFCFEVLDNNAGEAVVTIESNGGTETATLIRIPIVSVDEEGTTLAGLTVAPNPASEFIQVTAPNSSALRVRVISITGQTIAQLDGTDVVRWRLTDLNGGRVTPGLYVLAIEDGTSRTLRKVIVH